MIQPIDRRSFLTVGAAAVAGMAAPRLLASAPGVPVIAVGYWPQVIRMRAAANPRHLGVYAAESVMASEPAFARTGVRMVVRRLHRADSTPLALTLDVRHRADLVEGKVVFHAWSYSSTPGGVTASSPIAFTVPVDFDETVDLAITVRRPEGEARRDIRFTVAAAEGALRLNAGSYFLTIGNREPDWSAIRFENGRLTTILGGGPVPFDYLVVSVSPAS